MQANDSFDDDEPEVASELHSPLTGGGGLTSARVAEAPQINDNTTTAPV